MRLTTAEALAWFQELAGRALPKDSETVRSSRPDPYAEGFGYEPRSAGTQTFTYLNAEAAAAWVLEVGQALALCFPSGFELRAQWVRLTAHAEGQPHVLSKESTVDATRAVAKTAVRLLESGRLRSIWDGVRAETVGEVLEQALQLVDDGAPPASAAVLAGGALETHLRHLCDRADLLKKLKGHGSIGRYKGLLDAERKAGTEIITKGDGKQVVAWADDRNSAAHTPVAFAKTAPEVRLMIDGIRQFVARTE